MHRVSFQTLAGRSFDAEIPSTSEVIEMKKLEDSRKKAKDIGEELAKVGIFLQSASPRKSRPRSGAKADSNALPKLGNERSRPMSGRKGSNTKSAWNEDANL